MLLVYFFETDVFQINICDSGSINDINEINDTINVNEDERNIAHLNNLPLADRIRRRISWYLTAKGRKKYGSYNEFKSTWNPSTRVWNEIKSTVREDFKKSNSDAFQRGQESDRRAEELMSEIRESRRRSDMDRLNRFRHQFRSKK